MASSRSIIFLNALFIIADTLIAIEPFHFLVLLIVCVDIEEANRETDCSENEESDNKVHPPGDYQPPMAVGHVARLRSRRSAALLSFRVLSA